MLGVLDTWLRTLIFHTHILYLIPGGGLSPDGRQGIGSRPKFLLPVKALGAHLRTLFKARLQEQHPELFAQVPAKVWKRHWSVDSRAAGSGQNALRYLLKTATPNREVQLLAEGQVRWNYRESNTGRHTAITLQPLEFMARFLQHILPRGYARVRTFGWLHPAAKVRANRVRALLRQQTLLSPAEEKAWNPPPDSELELATVQRSVVDSAPLCPRCQQPMRLVASWRVGQVLLYPKRPP